MGLKESELLLADTCYWKNILGARDREGEPACLGNTKPETSSGLLLYTSNIPIYIYITKHS
jgi:hypothetical protein